MVRDFNVEINILFLNKSIEINILFSTMSVEIFIFLGGKMNKKKYYYQKSMEGEDDV